MSDAPRVSTRPGIWSVWLAAVGSPVGNFILGFIAVIAVAPSGPESVPDDTTVLDVAVVLRLVLVFAAIAVAIVLGAISMTHAAKGWGLPGSRAALALGAVGVVVGTLSSAFYIYRAVSIGGF